MMKYLLLLLFSTLITLMSYGQYDIEKVDDSTKTQKTKFDWSGIKEDLYVGGDVNAIFGNVSFIYFSPFVGYEFIPSVSAGISGMVRYESGMISGNVIGLFSKGTGLFVRYKPQIPIILESSFNLYSTSFSGVSQEAIGAKSWMLGIGYAYSMGERSYSQIIVQYDMLKNEYVPENLMLQFPGGGRLYYKFGFVYYLAD